MGNKEDYREQLQRIMNVSHDRLVYAIDNHMHATSDPIGIRELETFPINVWIELAPGIKAKKRRNRFGNFLNFSVKMHTGTAFAEHFHNDAIESTEVESGEMVDTTTGKIYCQGDVAHYSINQKHTPVATKETLLHVLFRPINDK